MSHVLLIPVASECDAAVKFTPLPTHPHGKNALYRSTPAVGRQFIHFAVVFVVRLRTEMLLLSSGSFWMQAASTGMRGDTSVNNNRTIKCISSITDRCTDRQTGQPVNVVVHLHPEDAGNLTCDRHGPGTMASWHRTHATDTTTYYGYVLLGGVGTAFGVVEHLLRLAIFVHCDIHHFLLSTMYVS